jgi:hypothetical protein
MDVEAKCMYLQALALSIYAVHMKLVSTVTCGKRVCRESEAYLFVLSDIYVPYWESRQKSCFDIC